MEAMTALLHRRDALVQVEDGLLALTPPIDRWAIATEWQPVWFGPQFVPARYRVEWVWGVIAYNPTWWTVSTGDNVQVLLSFDAGAIPSGLSASDRLLWPGLPRWLDQASALVGADSARPTQFIEWDHTGGPIGIAVWDPNYSDNAGASMFRLSLA